MLRHPVQRKTELRVRSALEAREEPGPFRGELEENGAAISGIFAATNVSKSNQTVAERRRAGEAHVKAVGQIAHADPMLRGGEHEQRPELREGQIDVAPRVRRPGSYGAHSRDKAGKLCFGRGHINTLRGIDYRC